MARKDHRRLRKLVAEVARAYPEIEDPDSLIRRGVVVVDGLVAQNPASLIRAGASVVIREDRRLRGEIKLEAGLSAFGVTVRDRVALDVGAAAGGFTRALLNAGARRVYAVDAGHGQLLGSLQQDSRVVSLERTNLGELDRTIVPDAVKVVSLDLSYLALAKAVSQLERVHIGSRADLLALVKPQFELSLSASPREAAQLAEAVARVRRALAANGWTMMAEMESPVRGAGGAVEFLVHAARKGGGAT